MNDLPGYGGGVYCRNCMSISHTQDHCPYMEDE